MADKKLGPCIMECKEYIKAIFTKHLNHHQTYTQLNNKQATYMIKEMNKTCISILSKNVKQTTENLSQSAKACLGWAKSTD